MRSIQRGSNRIAGFTTLEMVSAITIGAMTILLIMSVYMASLRYFNREYPSWVCNRSTELAMEYMTRDVRAAIQPVSSYGPVSTAADSIVLKVPSYDHSGIISNSYDYIAYAVNRDHNLTRTIVSGGGLRKDETNRVLADSISTLSFVYSCQDEFTGDGSTTSFTSRSAWSDTPTVTVNGQTVSRYSIDSGSHKITFTQAPSGVSTVGILYPVFPTDAAALAKVLMVNIQISSQQTSGRDSASSALSANVRLRNSR